MATTLQSFDAGTVISASEIDYRPAWSFGDFYGSLKEVAQIGTDSKSGPTWNISASQGRELKWKNFGANESDAASGNDLFLVVSKSSTHERSSKVDGQMSAVLDDVTMKLSFQELKSYDISAGSWHPGDLSDYNLKPGVDFEDLMFNLETSPKILFKSPTKVQ